MQMISIPRKVIKKFLQAYSYSSAIDWGNIPITW